MNFEFNFYQFCFILKIPKCCSSILIQILGNDLSAGTIANSRYGNKNNETETKLFENPFNDDVPKLTFNKPKNETSSSHRVSDLNHTDYVPVYGDRNKNHTAINEERWRILGKKRIDLLSKYGYSSHRDPVQITNDNLELPTENKHSALDNCYILGETKLTQLQFNQCDGANKTNRHSFCEYKPFSSQKCDFPKLKFFTPMDFKSINFDKDLSESPSNDRMEKTSPIQPIKYNLLPLIGESALNNYPNINNLTKPFTLNPMPNAFEDKSIKSFGEQTTPREKESRTFISITIGFSIGYFIFICNLFQ